jgi:hypothetical protein
MARKCPNIPIGNCTSEKLIDFIFGSVSEFQRQIELKGNEFCYGAFKVKYNPKTDIHSFYFNS